MYKVFIILYSYVILIIEIWVVRKLKFIRFCFKFGSKLGNLNNWRNNRNRFMRNVRRIKSNNKSRYRNRNRQKLFILSKNKNILIKLNTSLKQEPPI